MIKTLALLLVIFILSLPAQVLAAEPADGMIDGQIVNGTADGSSVANLDIALKIYLNGDEMDSATSVADTEGRFTFSDLLTEPEYSYEVSLFYQEAEYFSDIIIFSDNETTKSANIVVYNSTDDASAIMIVMAHTIIYAGENSIDVTEYYLFANDDDLTYIGSEVINEEGTKETLSFNLAAGVTQFQPTLGLMDCCIFSSEEGFIDTMAVMPGMKEISYSYTIDTGSGEYTLPLKINYPVVNYDLMVQGAEVVADQLTAEEPIVIEGIQYSHLSGSDIPTNTTLAISLAGLPVSNDQGDIIWLLAAVIVVGAGFSFVYLIKKRNLQPVSREDNPEQVRQRLLIQLAQLDDDFENGKIAEEDYKKFRAEGKITLMELMQITKDEKGSS
ncbi:hypothetical protein ACFLU1_02525 [Chloroflexota bacterium]